ncbi:hypothetical protein XELAEV_18016576mg [Xenopus laevis]|uniref:Uncharacterized protein n=1 Tax=Xenopus laevis TaxID=8355 RepID=A0A974HRK9_XENLA|nr:hypothetical protein XELAEV_18016576mg [Xenopus laevis]
MRLLRTLTHSHQCEGKRISAGDFSHLTAPQHRQTHSSCPIPPPCHISTGHVGGRQERYRGAEEGSGTGGTYVGCASF